MAPRGDFVGGGPWIGQHNPSAEQVAGYLLKKWHQWRLEGGLVFAFGVGVFLVGVIEGDFGAICFFTWIGVICLVVGGLSYAYYAWRIYEVESIPRVALLWSPPLPPPPPPD
ncbi:MAG TPA: hypothetical protein VGR51_02835 [Thermoplasmata archaeon]|jgi:hypothetical protein|nr:hypothetical protein [Thermoplasmata archaeon]